MTITSDVGYPYEASKLWYFGEEGIARSISYDRWDPDGVTDLSPKEKLRWSKVWEWLDNYFRRNPERRKPQSKGRNLRSLLCELETNKRFLVPSVVANVSNFPKHPLYGSNGSWTTYPDFPEFLLILVILSLVYGGIHLATWNFSFASKTEHLLWKIACIDIMATVPVGVLWLLVLIALINPDRLGLSHRKREIVQILSIILGGIPFSALSVLYALSRLYIVAEAFIGLRHVPIGVYAAVPWVQAIPHV